jgi:hypothetical protein
VGLEEFEEFEKFAFLDVFVLTKIQAFGVGACSPS